eukprot:scpid7199/ scgid23451/ 
MSWFLRKTHLYVLKLIENVPLRSVALCSSKILFSFVRRYITQLIHNRQLLLLLLLSPLLYPQHSSHRFFLEMQQKRTLRTTAAVSNFEVRLHSNTARSARHRPLSKS